MKSIRFSATYKAITGPILKPIVFIVPMLLALDALFLLLKDVDSALAYDGMAQIYLFVFGIITASYILEISLANGTSRKTTFLGELAGGISVSVIFSVTCLLLDLVYAFVCLLVKGDFSLNLFSYFEMYKLEKSFISGVLVEFLLIMKNFAYFFGGLFIGMLYYRMSRRTTIAVSVGVPCLLFIGLPFGVGLYSGWYYNKHGEEPSFDMITDRLTEIFSAYPLALLLEVLCAAVLVLLTFLLLRKAPLKSRQK